MVHFLVGLVLGGAVGYVTALLMVAAKEGRHEDWEGEE